MTEISSSNASLLAERAAMISRKFFIGDRDYSDFVLRWPSIKRTEQKVSPGNITIRLAAASGMAHKFLVAPETLVTSASLRIGAAGQAEDIVYQGTITEITVRNGVAAIQISDALAPLTSTLIGTRDSPVVYSGDLYPSDIFWSICTSHAGLSSIESSSNPHIDYAAYTLWRDEFIADSVFVNAQFSGIKALEALRKLARYTDSSIVADFTRITPRRSSSVGSGTVTIVEGEIVDIEVGMSIRRVINRMDVYGGYSVSSREWGVYVTDESSSSVALYGPRQRSENDASIWYVNSGSCANLVSRKLSRFSGMARQYRLSTGLTQLSRKIGDTFYVTDAQNGLENDFSRIAAIELNLNNGLMEFMLDVTSRKVGFQLDVSTLDGIAVLL